MKTYLHTAFTVASVAILYTLAAPAHGQATRTWVSGVGDDANPCSRTAPCKTFAGAISKTAAGGEINTLDSGGFGAVTITKSISIIAEGVVAGVLVSGTHGIVINVQSTDSVLLQGLDIEGLRTGLNGINIIGSGRTTIRRTSIRNFTLNGVNVAGPGGARAVIEDSLILNNRGGVNLQSGTSAIVRNSLLDANSVFATQADGTATLVLIGSTLIGSPFSVVTTSGAAVLSYGNNVLRNGGAPTQKLPLQ